MQNNFIATLFCLHLFNVWLTVQPSAAADELPLGIVATQPTSGRYVKTAQGIMVPYQAKIPLTEVEFTMIPIPGGKFLLGSPKEEAGRSTDEGAQVEIEIAPFWMSAHEIRWLEFKQYMHVSHQFMEIEQKKLLPITAANKLDVVTAPSSIYDPAPLDYDKKPLRPAVTVTQYSAKQYTKWLSGISQQFYRLPSEAEWEYACRAGTTTRYSFGDDETLLAEYAWYVQNSDEATHDVGLKKPNPLGLYDMHGNVAEWVLDGYDAQGYQKLADLLQQNSKPTSAIAWPSELSKRVVRGGSWDDKATALRSAARHPDDDAEWRSEDPSFPPSPWWYTGNYSLGVGFRIMRPLAVPPREAQEKFWQPDSEKLRNDIDEYIDNEGRGKRGIASPELIKVLQKLK